MDSHPAPRPAEPAPHLVWLHHAIKLTDLTPLGHKAATLARLSQRYPVPPGIVLLPSAFWHSQRHCNGAAIAGIPTRLSPIVLAELTTALQQLCPQGEWLAVRSSALEEDGHHQAMAGQLESFLGVTADAVADKVLAVWRSAFAAGVASYRAQHQISDAVQPPAVLIQRLIPAAAAGVSFGADPVTGQRGITTISAVYGLGAALMAGEAVSDRYRLNREGHILARQIADQPTAQRLTTVGVQTEPLEAAQRTVAVLQDDQIRAVAALTRRLGQELGRPQDVEWAIASDQIYLLQARPITTLATIADPDGAYCLWDNSNIVESYNGVTTPLTFAFARKGYTEVYQQFCRFMGVSDRQIQRHRSVFSNMIGCLQGRIYYNLLSWYRVLTLLPGYRLNARFLEQMLGLSDALPDAVIAELQRANRTHPLADGWRLGISGLRILGNYLTLRSRIRAYHQRLERVLLSPEELAVLPEVRPDELVGIYRGIEQDLLAHWDAPLINDFFAMIFYGVLRKLAVRWCGDTSSSLQNDLISVAGDVISTEPAQRLQQMAALVQDNRAAIATLCHGSLEEIQSLLQAQSELQQHYTAYLEKFGDRCLEELKLESPTLADDPLPLLRTLGFLAQQRSQPDYNPPAPLPQVNRTLAERQAMQALRRQPLKRWIFTWVMHSTRRLVRNRENLRFERTRVFGQARRVFLELGKRFYALDLLAHPNDIMFLEVEEIMGLVEGTASNRDLRGIVAVRQQTYQHQQTLPAPPRRFETRGIPDWGQPLSALPTPISPPTAATTWQGTGCAPGRVRGRISLVSNPRQWLQAQDAESSEPRILVAQSTDPGWILLFPHARGLLVERGSLLSHVAIVARELGLPMISDLPAITDQLQPNDWVEMDGHTGQLWRIDPFADEPALESAASKSGIVP